MTKSSPRAPAFDLVKDPVERRPIPGKRGRVVEPPAPLTPARPTDCVSRFMSELNLDDGTVDIHPIACKSWTCARCGPRRQEQARALALAGNPERHIVLTHKARPDWSLDKRLWFNAKAWEKLKRLLAQRHYAFQYFKALELTQQDTPHLHILHRGDFISKRALSQLWRQASGSFIVHISRINNSRAAVFEVIKYCLKTAGQVKTYAPGTRVFTTSRAWDLRPPEEDPDRPRNTLSLVTFKPRGSLWLEALHELGYSVSEIEGRFGSVHVEPRAPPAPRVFKKMLASLSVEDGAIVVAVAAAFGPRGREPGHVRQTVDLYRADAYGKL